MLILTKENKVRLLKFICILVGAMMFYRGIINLTQYPGNWERIVLGPVFLGGFAGVVLMWRGYKIGFWIFTILNFFVGYWFIFVLEDIWQHHVLPHIVFSAVFVPFYFDMKSSGFMKWVMGQLVRFGQFLLTIPFVLKIVEGIPWLSAWINRLIINSLVTQVRSRPHPTSTVHNYASWKGLTDKKWSARHLPASDKDINTLPGRKDLVELFRRPDGEQRLCPKSTCLFPAFAQYLTDGFIRTENADDDNPDDTTHLKRTTSNHDIDLCTLYGLNEKQMKALRVSKPGPADRGKLKSQDIDGEEYAPYYFKNGKVDPQFKDLDRPLGLDKLERGIKAAREKKDKKLLKFLTDQRNSIFAFGGDRVNSVPQASMINILLLREHNRIAAQLGEEHPNWDDDRVFETARNIVIVLFIKIVVEDYIRHIAPIKFQLKADPRAAWKAEWNRPNWIATEFSLLYRWHGLVPDEISWGGTRYPIGQTFLNNQPLIATGLARAYEDMSSQPAGELGLFNTTDNLLEVEEKSILHGRVCELASFSEYVEYMGRKPLKSMSDITRNKKAQELLGQIYKDRPEDVEFFIGLFAEDRVRNSPLPRTILTLVAVDAFSQALTNPLLSEHVF
ncbi:MAG: peroxidase family protein, partial [Desulfobulbia bacterium]